MVIRTTLTDIFGLEYPVVSAPMGWVSGGRLAAAVSNAGGLGLVAGAYGDPVWLQPQLEVARAEATRPWGVGLITWAALPETVDMVLRYRPAAVFLSFGDPQEVCSPDQVRGLRSDLSGPGSRGRSPGRISRGGHHRGAGSEAGGHSGVRATLPLVPAVVDAVAPVPVLAAGGIATGAASRRR